MDTAIRYHRDYGDTFTNWVVGTDHAGIATADCGGSGNCRRRAMSRHDPGGATSSPARVAVEASNPAPPSMRQPPPRRVRQLGFRRRERANQAYFTMDSHMSKGGRNLRGSCQRGVIYRGKRPGTGAAIRRGDLEVESVERDRPMWHIPKPGSPMAGLMRGMQHRHHAAGNHDGRWRAGCASRDASLPAPDRQRW